MRFAVKTRPEHQSWDELRDIWVAADEVPLFESIWNWDHFYPLTGDLTGPNFEGWTMLAAMAALTSRIRVGCQVTAMPYRHPAVLANMVATVDHVSSGRLILGIGAAWNEMECNAYGMPLNTFGRRPRSLHSPRDEATEHFPPSRTSPSSRSPVSPSVRSPGFNSVELKERNSNPGIRGSDSFPGRTSNCTGFPPSVAQWVGTQSTQDPVHFRVLSLP